MYGVHYDIYTDQKSLKYSFTQEELNMRQWRWLELVNDYECEIYNHPGKANRVTDALSQKSMAYAITMEKIYMSLQKDLCFFNFKNKRTMLRPY